mgnify:CR=1 FL=1
MTEENRTSQRNPSFQRAGSLKDVLALSSHIQSVLQAGRLPESKYLVDNFLPQDSNRSAFYEATEQASKRYESEMTKEASEERTFQNYLADDDRGKR